ncbi:MAG: O-antigen ligase family protein, partial [Planctomycetaceae bacterium]
VNEITQLFQDREIPMYGSSRIAWENRLLSSSEPFATFSLANTLAGILATGLVLLIGQASSTVGEQRRASWLSTMLLVIQICLIAYCLILTKSRSAWLGTCVGLVILLFRRVRLSAVQNVFRWLVVGSLLTAAAVGIGVAAGGLDKEVILESPRSLQFRLLYWTGTLKMLRNQPVTGAGPGNFRQVYLQYKADESSEEIRDPHNFALDAWSSSGLTGLSGLLLIIGCTGWRLMKRPTELSPHKIRGDQERLVAPRVRPLRIVVGGILSGFVLHIAWTWINGSDEWTSEPIRLLLLGGVSLLISRGKPSFRPLDSAACLAASTAMMVNLLAAGGFEMPAVMITLLLCLAAGIRCDGPQLHSRGTKISLLYAVACLVACTVITRFGLLPVTASGKHIEIGNSLLTNARFPSRALDQFQQALQADPQSVTPRQRIAEVLSYRLAEAAALRAAEMEGVGTETGEKTGRSKEDDDNRKLADDALQACENLISTDRRNSFSYRLRAETRWNAGLLIDDVQLRNMAVVDLKTAAILYPSSVDAWYRLAEQLDAAGVEHVGAAKDAAERVLQLEELNRTWRHADRFLTEEQLVKISRIAGQ